MPPSPAAKAKFDQEIERIVREIEKGGAWPKRGDADYERLRRWLRPGGREFRQDVFDRIKRVQPDRIPGTVQAAVPDQMEVLIASIEEGGEWPDETTTEGGRLRRWITPGNRDFNELAHRRIATARPDKVPARPEDVGAKMESIIQQIERGGPWPAPDTAAFLRLSRWLRPTSRQFRPDVLARFTAALSKTDLKHALARVQPDPIGAAARAWPYLDEPVRRRRGALWADVRGDEIVTKIERGGLWPHEGAPEGRLLRRWLRPSDLSFRPDLWRRIEAVCPERLDYDAYQAAQDRLAAIISAIEDGGPSPRPGSHHGTFFSRAITPGHHAFQQWAWDRLAANAPDRLPPPEVAAQQFALAAVVARVEQAGAWPVLGSPDELILRAAADPRAHSYRSWVWRRLRRYRPENWPEEN